ncbi:DUF2924 domain-containing protein [Henriciella aquimarina]|uniref:DUF2924 domain-containing protein n=1 Tax=Henriciella aquimarina TaxID=545261 RepID=UPI000A00BEA1|nr:DUF2924 domain-containing protein [Henriciella aquimarina]
MAGHDMTIIQKIASLQAMDIADLKSEWRRLFDTDPPAFNRKTLEARLAYRIQELAFGGLSKGTRRRLKDLGERVDGGDPLIRHARVDNRPATGTQLIREWQGEDHVVTVTPNGYEWGGRPYKSLSAVARAITGTRWNGWVFFGLKRQGGG